MIKILAADIDGVYIKRVYFCGILIYHYQHEQKKEEKRKIGHYNDEQM